MELESNDNPSSVLQLRVLSDEDPSDSSRSRQPKHSPLVMTPGGSFAKANGRSAYSFSSPYKDSAMEEDDDEEEEGDEESNTESCIAQNSSSPILAAAMDTSNTSEFVNQTTAPDSSFVKQSPFQQVGLYGGAILVTLPVAFEDISVVRQVPDHQEVFVDRNSEMSFIVELVAHNRDVSHADAPKFFFTDLAECNEAQNVIIDSAAVISDSNFAPHIKDASCVKCAVTGRQTVSKFRKEDSPLENVQIILVIIRLVNVDHDMLLSINVPCSDAIAPLTVDSIMGLGGDSPAAIVMATALSSLQICDWSLFA